ncbi:hypothetical protein [Polaromonas glacialis]|uniref:hypothetical protein n=1 Tax=Polaromonas glacialis TaxID=866564 RepID=UPI0004954E0D|nr:hypothetical protein [Polaromonas glacialis]
MGVAISALNQVVLDTTPTLENVGGVPDIAILSSGVKRRHTYFSRTFEKIPGIVRITCATQHPAVGSFSTAPMSNKSTLMQQLLAAAKDVRGANKPLKIMIDVSCLPRPFIAEVFACLTIIAQTRDVELHVAYSLATYGPSPLVWAVPNRTICPVHPTFSGWTSEGASAPLDIVVGLGYERGKALGAVEYLEPRHRWICVPQSPEAAYLAEVRRHNKNLIDNSKERVAYYQVLSPVDTYFSLRSLVEGIARGARPVLLPFGPKLFFAVNLLVAMTVEEAAVWHVTGESDEYSERSPSRHSTILSCLISQPQSTLT